MPIELTATMKATRYGDHTCTVWRRFPGSRWSPVELYSDMTRDEATSLLDTLVDQLLLGRYL